MSDPETALAELAGPPRDQAVGCLLEAMARALDSGADVVPEPEIRDAGGAVARSGTLQLPRRGDLAVVRGGRRLVRQVESGEIPAGESVVLATEAGFVAEIAPFRWDGAGLTVFAGTDQPDWAPLRRWFLEWFQSRLSEVAPDLLGAVHSLDGPWRRGRGWGFTVDFGSAPLACLDDLIAALAKTGAARMRLADS